MCNTQQAPTTIEPETTDREIQIARLNLQLAQTRANTEYYNSVAGQIQQQFEAMQRCAKPYAESTIVPAAYRQNIGNCIIALEMAHRMALPPITVMQNLFVVNGTPSWASKFLVATINTCGRFTNIRYRKRNLGKVGKIRYNDLEWNAEKKQKTTVIREFDGSSVDNWECVAYATEKATGEVLESDAVTIAMAIQEGWYTKTGSKWVTMPMLMLSYRAAAFWQRVYAPEIAMGFRTVEEEEDAAFTDYEDVSDNTEPATTPQQHTTISQNLEEAKERLRNKSAKSVDGQAVQQKFEMP